MSTNPVRTEYRDADAEALWDSFQETAPDGNGARSRAFETDSHRVIVAAVDGKILLRYFPKLPPG